MRSAKFRGRRLKPGLLGTDSVYVNPAAITHIKIHYDHSLQVFVAGQNEPIAVIPAGNSADRFLAQLGGVCVVNIEAPNGGMADIPPKQRPGHMFVVSTPRESPGADSDMSGSR